MSEIVSSKTFAVELVSRAELAHFPRWKQAFGGLRKDHRYFEIVEDTIHQGFDHRYFVIKDGSGAVQAIQPCFILDQDLLQGAGSRAGTLAEGIRQWWPRFMRLRSLMVGCAAGEGHLDATEESARHGIARALAPAIVGHARNVRAPLIVLKEFPTEYRASLGCFLDHGFTRVPSMPMTKLNISYASFEEYMNRALGGEMRRNLRRKFRSASRSSPIEMSVIDDVTPFIEDIFPLYLNVFERSKLQFEKLTKEYLCRLGKAMPDKVRFFIWRQNEKIVAFIACMLQGDAFYAEYIGLDYTVALDLHLYHYTYRDMVSWAMANGYKEFRSSGLNYDPKLHLKHLLDPIDLYIRHASVVPNAALKLFLPLLEPTRSDPTLRKFSNYGELWGTPAGPDR